MDFGSKIQILYSKSTECKLTGLAALRHRAHYDVIVMFCNDSVLSATKFKNVAGIAHTHSQGHQGLEMKYLFKTVLRNVHKPLIKIMLWSVEMVNAL